jgi:hypothetical protein
MGMKENSTPGTNGFGVVFFKKFWEVIKGDLERSCFRIFIITNQTSKG